MLIEVAYCRICGSYVHKWKDSEREGSKGPFKEVFSEDENVHLKLLGEFGGDTAVNVEKRIYIRS